MKTPGKDPAAVAMAAKRHASMTPERRREIAKMAIETRWRNVKKAKRAAAKVAKE